MRIFSGPRELEAGVQLGFARKRKINEKRFFKRGRKRERGGCLSKGRLLSASARVRGWVRACVCELVTVVLSQGETEREDVTI